MVKIPTPEVRELSFASLANQLTFTAEDWVRNPGYSTIHHGVHCMAWELGEEWTVDYLLGTIAKTLPAPPLRWLQWHDHHTFAHQIQLITLQPDTNQSRILEIRGSGVIATSRAQAFAFYVQDPVVVLSADESEVWAVIKLSEHNLLPCRWPSLLHQVMSSLETEWSGKQLRALVLYQQDHSYDATDWPKRKTQMIEAWYESSLRAGKVDTVNIISAQLKRHGFLSMDEDGERHVWVKPDQLIVIKRR